MNVNGAVMTLAHQAARKAVKRQFQAQGLKVSHIAAREITAAANDYLRDHPELIAEARVVVERWLAQGVFGKRAQRAWAHRATLNTHAQKSEA